MVISQGVKIIVNNFISEQSPSGQVCRLVFLDTGTEYVIINLLSDTWLLIQIKFTDN